jgi:hypothetical protein
VVESERVERECKCLRRVQVLKERVNVVEGECTVTVVCCFQV